MRNFPRYQVIIRINSDTKAKTKLFSGALNITALGESLLFAIFSRHKAKFFMCLKD